MIQLKFFKTFVRSFFGLTLIFVLKVFGAEDVTKKINEIKEAAQSENEKALKELESSKAWEKIVNSIQNKNSTYKANENRGEAVPEEIEKKDEAWKKWNKDSQLAKKDGKAQPVTESFIESILGNPCSEELRNFKNKKTGILEIFVMDRMGANVCAADPTSDYDQGDEAKWKKPFLEAVSPFVDLPTRDSSANAYQTQVSSLVKNKKGEKIGVITIGLKKDH